MECIDRRRTEQKSRDFSGCQADDAAYPRMRAMKAMKKSRALDEILDVREETDVVTPTLACPETS